MFNSLDSMSTHQIQQHDQDHDRSFSTARLESSKRQDDMMIRRQQGILREQMGFKFVEPSFSSNLSTGDDQRSSDRSNKSPFASDKSFIEARNHIISAASHERQRQQLARNQERELYQHQVISHRKRIQLDQYEQLEDITRQLKRLEQEQESMRQQIIDHPDVKMIGSSMNFDSNWNNESLVQLSHNINGRDVGFSNNSRNSRRKNNDSNQSFSVDSLHFAADVGNRQKEEILSSTSSNTFPKGFSSYPGLFGCNESSVGRQRQKNRRNSLFSIEDNVQIGRDDVFNHNDGTAINNNHSSCPISFLPSTTASTSPHRNSRFDTDSGDDIDDGSIDGNISPIIFTDML